MTVEVRIDSEAVNKMLADAILGSALGKSVEEAIKRQIASLNTSYDNPIDSVIAQHMQDIVRKLLVEQHGDLIREKVKAALANKLTDEFIDRVCEKAADRY